MSCRNEQQKHPRAKKTLTHKFGPFAFCWRWIFLQTRTTTPAPLPCPQGAQNQLEHLLTSNLFSWRHRPSRSGQLVLRKTQDFSNTGWLMGSCEPFPARTVDVTTVTCSSHLPCCFPVCTTARARRRFQFFPESEPETEKSHSASLLHTCGTNSQKGSDSQKHPYTQIFFFNYYFLLLTKDPPVLSCIWMTFLSLLISLGLHF